MKLIHTADLHLGSRLNANLESDKGKMRRAEMVHTFARLISYAETHEVNAILIAGDLFDTAHISKNTSDIVYGEIENHPRITFYYLKGNHDRNDFLDRYDAVPENLKLFTDHWTSYDLSEKVTLSGMELNADNAYSAASYLSLNPEKINLVMLHGQVAKSLKKGAEIIDLRAFSRKGIDYMALGHIHMHQKEKLDSRGIWVYSGCLEGRGFDETGEHGFSFLDIDEQSGKVEETFVPFASRICMEVPVDLTGVWDWPSAKERIDETLLQDNIKPESLIKIVLKGAVPLEMQLNLQLITKTYEDRFFAVKAEDETHPQIRFEDFRNDISLKGEFVRQVEADENLSEEEKARVIKIGFEALRMEV